MGRILLECGNDCERNDASPFKETYFNRIFAGITIINNRRIVIKESSRLSPETYSEPCQTSKMELFAKISNGLFLQKGTISDVPNREGSKYASGYIFKVINKLTHFTPMDHFYTPWKQKTKAFSTFLGGIKMGHWRGKGWYVDTAQKMKCSIKDFFSKCNRIRSFLRI